MSDINISEVKIARKKNVSSADECGVLWVLDR